MDEGSSKGEGGHEEMDEVAGEQSPENDVRYAYLMLPDNSWYVAAYQVFEDRAITEGDIDLGEVKEVEEVARLIESIEPVQSGKGLDDERLKDSSQFKELSDTFGNIVRPRDKWPGGKVPYTIDSNLPKQERVREAITHWQEATSLTFVKRTTEAAYVTFTTGRVCSSAIGYRKNRRQYVRLASGCSRGNAIHEIGHAIGLYHEQTHSDRDQHVKILWNNIQAGKASQFRRHGTEVKHGPYHYGSVMHYGPYHFSKNGKKTIVAPVAIGQRRALSRGDVAAVAALYPGRPSDPDAEAAKSSS